ncbi:AbgT family transporter [Paracoccus sp. PAR01]|uniref:AbgT family transporter n=1 Tax=Paracoccus sp. PAR01 TaxID=2769282 RepID=UPI0017832B2A|nr:AbgT family transporter [Paracoccus sp. PAR01]MBD9527644.1 AbgT family transporter [Paracoccus sp. PAR01]
MSGFLGTIERVGNMVPHPAIIFFILIGIVIILSVIFSAMGTSVTYEGYDPVISDIVTQTSSVRSLLSPDGIRFMVTSPVANFLGFTGVGVILVAMIGVGLAEESGLIATLVRKLVAAAPRSIFTFMIVMVGVLSSIAADAGYLVLVPLAAAAFHSMGRHPLAGLAAGFSGVAAVFLVNVFVTPTDALLVEVTNDSIRTVNPNAQITVVGNLFFMIASSILMGIICTILTEKFVEPRLGPYSGGLPVEASTELSEAEQRGLKYAGRALLIFVLVLAALTAPPLPWGILRNQETGGIMAGSPFMSGLIVLISLLFMCIGYAYGRGAGTIANVTAAIGLVVKTWSNLAGMIFLLFVIANFIAFFNFTNLATVLAVNLADFLQTTQLGANSYIILFVVVVAIIDIILTGALAKWAILAPVFVPLFMRLGGDPNLVLAAYRVGDSPMNVITPLNVYLAVMVGFAQKYQKDAGIGTIVALMLPYTIVLLVLWTLLLVAWYGFGLPLGPA